MTLRALLIDIVSKNSFLSSYTSGTCNVCSILDLKKSKILITNTETIDHIDNGEMNLIAKDISNNYKKLPTNKNCARQVIDLIINATIKLQKSIAKLLGFSLYPRIVLFNQCE